MTFSAMSTARPGWKRALVTGGAGFLGSHLCERLLDGGVGVDCVDNLSSGSADHVRHLAGRPGFRLLQLDVADPGAPDALAGPYDLVLHCAGPASPADCRDRPLDVLDTAGLGTRNALAVADRAGARFLLASAGRVHGDPLGVPRPQEVRGDAGPDGPCEVYDVAKRFSEALTAAYATAHGTDAGIVRLFDTYGPRMRTDDPQSIPAFVEQALTGGPVIVTDDGTGARSLCYVDDVVDGVLRVAASRSLRPVDIGGGDETTVQEIARRVIDLTGSRADLRFGTAHAPDRARRRPDPSFACELFGWMPRVSWEEGFKRTIAHVAGGRQGAGGRERTGGPSPLPEGGTRHACCW
ncbi:NAD-dependent epimerase/dehydratase family protein [Streptomyces chromofuscus]|uniref:NAD-dependent epimerase/dehydratase family protein n=2 Tax=Streptomyces chromofuscus TaxID=42881 RepID=A0A7M2TGY2_STRCW|nr:NAD-dependent epimerase/dehydratase family protein [Streptomyces chromofuscus]